MNATKQNLPRPVATGQLVERMARAPRLVCSATARAVLPVAMGNRAFIRAWAARRAGNARAASLL